jgi:hypothetical protein
MHPTLRLLLVMAALALTTPLAAQVTETPAAFDSAGKVRTLTPALVTRLALTPASWPVTGDFREARIFSVSTGGVILVVERRTGAMERYPLSDDAARGLRSDVDRALSSRGSLVTESQTDLVTEQASAKFVRNQVIVTALLYAPALATQFDQAQTSSAVYLLTTGSSYFIASAIANKTTVSRVQNDLATDGAFRGAFMAGGLYAAFGPDESDAAGTKESALVSLAGALGGSIAGFQRARGLTDAEGKAAKSASTYATLTAGGLMSMTGVNGEEDYRLTSLVSVAAGMTGYWLGPGYPRRARYSVTAGDINTMWIGSTLGVAAAFIPFITADSISERGASAIFTSGLLGGAFLAERGWVRRYDHTQGDVAQMWLGTLGGALMGGAVAILVKPNATGALSMVTAGGLLGALASQNLSKPARAGSRSASRNSGDAARAVEFSPASLAMAASGVRGRHGVLTIRF